MIIVVYNNNNPILPLLRGVVPQEPRGGAGAEGADALEGVAVRLGLGRYDMSQHFRMSERGVVHVIRSHV